MWNRLSIFAILMPLLAPLLTWCQPCSAAQYLVRAGEDWQALESKLRPGDEIILMPGQHRAASFERLIGTAKRPITIRGVNAEQPPTILAEGEGLRVERAAHLVIRNLIITGAKMNGIHLSGEDATNAAGESVQSRSIIIRDVTITQIGPRGLRHSILIRNLNNVRIEDCTFTGWGGSAIELVGCTNVRIRECAFRGLHDHSQMHGVRARALSREVEIDDCRFENAGEIAVSMGGASRVDDLSESMIEGAADASLFEVSQMQLQRVLIIGSRQAVAFINATDCSVRNSTIIRPRAAAFAASALQSDARFNPGRNNFIGRNVIVWEASEGFQLIEIGERVDADKIMLDANVWWCGDSAQRQPHAGPAGRLMMPQVTGIDPQLDSSYKATNPQADGFGV